MVASNRSQLAYPAIAMSTSNVLKHKSRPPKSSTSPKKTSPKTKILSRVTSGHNLSVKKTPAAFVIYLIAASPSAVHGSPAPTRRVVTSQISCTVEISPPTGSSMPPTFAMAMRVQSVVRNFTSVVASKSVTCFNSVENMRNHLVSRCSIKTASRKS